MKKTLLFLLVLSFGLVANGQDTLDVNYDMGFNDADEGYCIAQTNDGGYILSGASFTSDEKWFDMTLMKIDSTGIQEWIKTYGIGSAWLEVGYGVTQTPDGGYAIMGGTDGFDAIDHMWLIKTDANGDSLWSETFGGASGEYAQAGILTADSGFALAGATSSFGAGSDDVYLVKTDADGQELWSKTYGTSQQEGAYDLQQTTDGGYILAGACNGYTDFYIVKTDAQGDTIWTRTYGGGATEEAYSIKQTTDGGYIVTGSTQSFGAGSYDVWLVKLDANGDKIWDKTYGGQKTDKGWSVIQTSDGGYFITGYTESFTHAEEDSDMYLIRTNATGDTLWTKSFGDYHDDGGHWNILNDKGQFVSLGYKFISGEGTNFYLVILNDQGTVDLLPIRKEKLAINIVPNPVTTTATIKFENPNNSNYFMTITNINGQIVKEKPIINNSETTFNRENLPAGTYFISVKGDKEYFGKLMIE